MSNTIWIGNSGAISYKHIDGLRYYSRWPQETMGLQSKMKEYKKNHPEWEEQREWSLCEEEITHSIRKITENGAITYNDLFNAVMKELPMAWEWKVKSEIERGFWNYYGDALLVMNENGWIVNTGNKANYY